MTSSRDTSKHAYMQEKGTYVPTILPKASDVMHRRREGCSDELSANSEKFVTLSTRLGRAGGKLLELFALGLDGRGRGDVERVVRMLLLFGRRLLRAGRLGRR